MQIISLMKVAPLTEDDSLGKAALFTKYIEALPHALDSWKETGLGLVTKLLSGIQRVVQQNILVHQNLFRYASQQRLSANLWPGQTCICSVPDLASSCLQRYAHLQANKILCSPHCCCL